MSPFKSITGRALGKLLEGYKSSDIGKGFGSGGGGGSSTITSIANLSSQASWINFPNGGNYSTTFSDSNYYGARGTVVDTNGTIRHNSHEYGIYTKFNCRDHHTMTCLLYTSDAADE